MSLAPTLYRLKPEFTIEDFLKHPISAPHPIDANLRFHLYLPNRVPPYSSTFYWNENANAFNRWTFASGRSHASARFLPLCPNVRVYHTEPFVLSTYNYGTAIYRSVSCWNSQTIRANRPINASLQTATFSQVIAYHDVLSHTEFLKYFYDPATPLKTPNYYSPATKHKYGYASNDLSNLRNPNYKRRLLKKPLLF